MYFYSGSLQDAKRVFVHQGLDAGIRCSANTTAAIAHFLVLRFKFAPAYIV